MYCEPNTTWATIEDLYARFGDEYMDKKATRRNYDEETKSYVADEDPQARAAVINLALCDAKALITQKLSCLYSDVTILNEHVFSSVKQWHIIMTIAILDKGGDCASCDCTALDAWTQCGNICSDDGTCLTSVKTFIVGTKAHFPCECHGRCGCC